MNSLFKMRNQLNIRYLFQGAVLGEGSVVYVPGLLPFPVQSGLAWSSHHASSSVLLPHQTVTFLPLLFFKMIISYPAAHSRFFELVFNDISVLCQSCFDIDFLFFFCFRSAD